MTSMADPVIVFVGEEEEYEVVAPKNVLERQSSYFNSLFAGRWEFHQRTVVDVVGNIENYKMFFKLLCRVEDGLTMTERDGRLVLTQNSNNHFEHFRLCPENVLGILGVAYHLVCDSIIKKCENYIACVSWPEGIFEELEGEEEQFEVKATELEVEVPTSTFIPFTHQLKEFYSDKMCPDEIARRILTDKQLEEEAVREFKSLTALDVDVQKEILHCTINNKVLHNRFFKDSRLAIDMWLQCPYEVLNSLNRMAKKIPTFESAVFIFEFACKCDLHVKHKDRIEHLQAIDTILQGLVRRWPESEQWEFCKLWAKYEFPNWAERSCQESSKGWSTKLKAEAVNSALSTDGYIEMVLFGKILVHLNLIGQVAPQFLQKLTDLYHGTKLKMTNGSKKRQRTGDISLFDGFDRGVHDVVIDNNGNKTVEAKDRFYMNVKVMKWKFFVLGEIMKSCMEGELVLSIDQRLLACMLIEDSTQRKNPIYRKFVKTLPLKERMTVRQHAI